ncbi:MAG TPA: LamG-like jellyroll fold domain-containing protein [Polyangiaceae bacterium LLY-WYZ-14_1]|nr:LamG-like jellyroll fold domain-containing protein [Polyangiaceae bacterium LLY-WYZ-14_1]
MRSRQLLALRLLVVLICLPGYGCGRVGFDPQALGLDDGTDAGPRDGGVPNADAGPAPLDDAGRGDDAGPQDDGGPVGGDAGDGPPFDGCTDVDPDTVFLFDFEDVADGVLRDRTGSHDGTLTLPVEGIPGPPGCGQAWWARGTVFGRVGYDPAFELAEGSLDFWARVDELPPEGRRGLLSRDSVGPEEGHLSVTISTLGRLRVRLQQTGVSAERCFDDVPLGTWFQIGINFGPPGLEVFFDGSTAGAATSTVCTRPIDTGLEGNANNWVFGGDNTSADEGSDDAEQPFEGALDEVRLSRVRRDFRGC